MEPNADGGCKCLGFGGRITVSFLDRKIIPVKIMTGIGDMEKITIGLLLIMGLSGCSTSGSLSVSEKTMSYDLSPIVYEKHEAVVYPAGTRNDL